MHNIIDAFMAMGEAYTKILQVNLSDRSYEIIKVDQDELPDAERWGDDISVWIREFALSGNVYDEDISLFLNYSNIENIKRYFMENDTPMYIRYRRKFDDEYRWVMLEIVKSKEYTLEYPCVFVLVRDVGDSLSREFQQFRELERVTSVDPLTGINNQYAFRRMCVLFEEAVHNISVGVVYADLNGLKNVNDIQGHEAGDDFICSFANKIREFQLSPYAYRVGGDEFLLVFHDMSEEEMRKKMQPLIDWNNCQIISVASIGMIWVENTTDFFEVIKEAERRMYEQKRSLYELHPEFSREAIDRKYSEEMTAIIMNLSEAYTTLGVVDMVDESYRLIKFDSSINYVPPSGSFREYITGFQEKLVTPDSKKMLKKMASIEVLRKDLLKNPTITFDYQMKNGAWRQVTFRQAEVRDGVLTKAIFYSCGLNQYMSERMNERQTADEESEILEGIHREYTLMCLVNPVKGDVHIYKYNNLPEELYHIINESHFVDAIAWFAKKYVSIRDYEMFMKAVDMEQILNKLESEPMYRLTFHCKPSFHNTPRESMGEMIFSRVSAQSEHIVLVTKQLPVEDDDADLLKNRVIMSMGDDFKSIFYVDLVNRQLTAYRMNYRLPVSFWNYVATNPSYEDVMNMYIEGWVILEDKAWIREQTSIANLRRILRKEPAYSCDHRVSSGGKILWYRMKVVNLAEGDELRRFAVGYADVTEEKNNYIEYFDNLTQNLFGATPFSEDDENIRKVLERDGLTGLYHKEYFYNYAEKILKANPDKEYTIHVTDIENFKLINEKYGMRVGDDVLKTIAQVSPNIIPFYVMGGRLDGDRFVCLREYKDFSLDAEQELVQQLSSMLSVPNIVLKSGFYKVDNETSVQLMCDRATIALNRIKGKFGVDAVEYNDTIHRELLHEQQIIDDMREALRTHQFQVYYQPKHHLDTNKTGGAEALVRWVHPDLGFMNPNVFIPLFEKNGFITLIDLYVLEEVCKCVYARYSMGKPNIPISVNLSRRDLEQENLTQQIVQIVDRYGIEHRLIHFEVTESAYSNEAEQISKNISQLHECGFVIELDDFGVGYSSIATLNSLNLDVMKLDISIVRNDVPGSEKNVLEFALQLAELVGLQTVAEGVETEAQMQRLKSLGCDYIQGYYYAKPMPKEEFEAYIDGEV